MSEAALVLVSLFVGGAGLLIILFGSNLVSVTLGVGMTGLGLAAIFPTTFAIFTRYFGAQSSELTGSFFVVGGLGGAYSFVGGIRFRTNRRPTPRTSRSRAGRSRDDRLAALYSPGARPATLVTGDPSALVRLSAVLLMISKVSQTAMPGLCKPHKSPDRACLRHVPLVDSRRCTNGRTDPYVWHLVAPSWHWHPG